MARLRPRGAAFLTGLLLILGGSRWTAAAVPATIAISGIARDSVGHVLPDVDVFVLGEVVGMPPMAVARTNSEGRYVVADLAPGSYRVAALKEGYLAFLGRINTLFRTSLEVVLRPLPPEGQSGSTPVAADSSWMLRLPARSLLRETDAKALVATDDGAARAPAHSRLSDAIEGELDHLFALTARVPGSPRDASDFQGAETHMRLASALGDRGNIQLQGRRDNLDSVSGEGDSATQASRDASTVLLRLTYDMSQDENLAVNAYYAHRDLSLGPPAASEFDPGFRQAQRAWGYDARWSRQLDASSRVAVQVGYVDAALDVSPSSVGAASLGETDPSSGRLGLANRAVAAEGSYESLAADRHQLRVDLRAQLLDLPMPLVRAANEDAFLGATGAAGWSVGVKAEDNWALAGPMTLVYGLGYERYLDGGAAMIEPRAGAIWSQDGLRVRMVLSYDLSTPGRDAASWSLPTEPYGARAGALGYEAEIEAPLSHAFRIKGTIGYSPYQLGTVGYEHAAQTVRPLYATDGNAAVCEKSVSVEREAGGIRAYLEISDGRAQGTLAAILPFDAPVQVLAERRLSYRGGRLGVRITSTGTDIAAEYRKVEESASPAEEATPGLVQQYVELQLAQDLLRLRGRGMSWRFLLAARMAPWGDGAGAATSADEESRILAALGHRVSAGVSVSF